MRKFIATLALTLPLTGCIANESDTALNVPLQQNQQMESVVMLAWKTIPVSSNIGVPKVELFLQLQGATQKEVSVGVFPGTQITSPLDATKAQLLYRSWWSGTDDIVFVERKDDTHIVVHQRTFTSTNTDEAPKELAVVEVPSNVRVQDVDL